VPGLQPGPGNAAGVRYRSGVLAGLLFFPQFPQVVVVLQELQQHIAPLLVHELLKVEGGHPGSGGTGELAGQRVEHAFGNGERISRGNCAVRCHGGFFFLEVRIGQHLRT